MCELVNCGQTFTREDNLKVHMKNHGNLKKYQCQHCAALFSRNGNLTEHIRRNHSPYNEDNKNWSCADCSKQFHTRQQLERHRRIHLGEKPHKCEFCEKSFTRYFIFISWLLSTQGVNVRLQITDPIIYQGISNQHTMIDCMKSNST